MVTDLHAQRKQLNLKYEKRKQFGKLSQNKPTKRLGQRRVFWLCWQTMR